MEKNYTFKDKIDIILKIKEIKLKEVEKALDVDGTFYKAYKENREPRPELLAEFLRKFHVKKSWWKSPSGGTEAAVFEENPTLVTESTGSKEKHEAESIYRDLVEANSDYRLVPKTVLEGEYRMLLKSEIEDRSRMWREALDSKNDLIKQLKEEIAELRAIMRPAEQAK